MMLSVHHVTHWIAWTVGGNLRRQKNRRLVLPFHWMKWTVGGLLTSSYVVLALLWDRVWIGVRRLLRNEFWFTSGVEGHGLVVGSVSCYPKGYLFARVFELMGVRANDPPWVDCLKQNAVDRVDKHQDDTDRNCECNSTIRYSNMLRWRCGF